MSLPVSRAPGTLEARDVTTRALDRATGARPVPGNALRHFPDSPTAIERMLALIAGAHRTIHFENYIIRGDATGRRFAAALTERARAGVVIRVLGDAVGSRFTPAGFWRHLRQAGVDVRVFNPVLTARPFRVFRRDHRKLLVVDGGRAVLGGLCIGDEWAGDAARGRRAWRDTMVEVCGPAVAVLDATFAHVWRRAGPPLPDAEVTAGADPCGPSTVRVVEGVPGQSRIYRAEQVLAAGVAERLWITDAYFVAPPPLYQSLLAAARDGVDVRLLLPSSSDIPILRNFTRVGYRDLLAAGVRVFEWRGPMLHAKTMVADRRWARVGSSNLNVSSLLGNYELDVLVECDELAGELAAQFRRDLASSSEIVIQARRRMLPPRLVRTPASAAPAAPPSSPEPALAASRHKRSRYELGQVAVVALRRVAGGVRRAIAGTAAIVCTVLGALLLLFPRVATVVLAAGAFWLALGFGWFAVAKRRWREGDDVP